MSFMNDLDNQFNEDILDEFLDQRVYNYSPKEVFDDFDNEFSNKDEMKNLNLTSNHNSNSNLNLNSNNNSNNNSGLNLNKVHVSPPSNGQYSYNMYDLDDLSPNENINIKTDSNPFNNSNQHNMNDQIGIKLEDDSVNFSLTSSPSGSISLPPHIENKSNDKRINDYNILRDEVSKLKFGKYNMNYIPENIDPTPEMLDFSNENLSNLPYKLNITNLPDYSRVETQIKINLNLSPSPFENLLHLPQDLILKNKFCLFDSVDSLNSIIKKNLLFLECYVMTADLKKSCNICSKCIKREQKRASRRRGADDQPIMNNSNTSNSNNNINNNIINNSGSPEGGMVKNNPNVWSDENMMKKAVIFNCKEIISFPAPTGIDSSKSIELSARLICYCRHHQESKGFKLLFVLKDHLGQIVAKQLSTPIMIMDRKKPTNNGNTSSSSISNGITNNNNNNNSNINNDGNSLMPSTIASNSEDHPISPNSIDESSDLTTDERGLKRKKLSVDDNLMYNGSVAFSPISNSDTSSMRVTKPQSTMRTNNLITPPVTNLPTILRIIPAQGPIRGGIEVTLLGFNFNSNLLVKFGTNSALATHCWSETTIVTYLPPSAVPGQVLVSFEGQATTNQQQIFTYTDDTDKQLIELALQIVGLKMNGKLEDAKNIAKRIVGSGSTGSSPSIANTANTTNGNNTNTNTDNLTSVGEDMHNDKLSTEDWYTNAKGMVNQLNTNSTESTVISLLKLVDLPNCPTIPNWQLTNNQGQTLLHLATVGNYIKLVKFLINHGCSIEYKDNLECSALFYAGVFGHRELISLYQNYGLKDEKVKEYCDLNVIDLVSNNELRKSGSIASLASIELIESIRRRTTIDHDDHEFDGEYEDSDFDDDYNDNSSNSSNNNAVGELDDADDTQRIRNFEVETDAESVETEIMRSRSDTIGTELTEVTDQDIGDNNNNNNNNNKSKNSSNDNNGNERGLWQKVKDVFNKSDDDLPNYDDLFPFGQYSKPKTQIEKELNALVESDTNIVGSMVEGGSSSNTGANTNTDTANNKDDNDKGEVDSDSSEDMVISYINHPRKTVENDKMLIFFWIPVLILIICLFILINMGYKFKIIENFKNVMRDGLGNLMVGNERIKRVFSE